MRAAGLVILLRVCLVELSACQPDLGAPSSLVQSPRILAVRSQPAEVAPGESVTLQLLLASAAGEVTATSVDWAFCQAAKPPVDNNVVGAACLGDAVQAISAHAAQVSAPIPTTACALFGPQLPPTPAGQPPARPRDPDGTGGYYQHVRVRPVALPGDSAMTGYALTRILCGLAGAAASTSAAYRDLYQPNRNPQIIAVRIMDVEQELLPSALPGGHALQLHITWQSDAAEHFPVFDLAAQTLVERTEALQLAWFANAGRFTLAHTTAGPGATESVNEWTAPLTPGPVTVWIILRDDRGGVDWRSLALRIG